MGQFELRVTCFLASSLLLGFALVCLAIGAWTLIRGMLENGFLMICVGTTLFAGATVFDKMANAKMRDC